MNKLSAVVFLYLCLMAATLPAQRTYSVSAGLGTSYYYGDLTDGFNNLLIRPAFSLMGTKYLTPQLGFRAGITQGYIGASDSLAKDNDRVVRGLSFRSPITELSGVMVFEFTRDKNFGVPWQKRKKHLTPYVYGGISMFHFNPKAKLNGVWYKLQPLGTEGQFIKDGGYPAPYARVQMSVPFGGGIGIRLAPQLGMNLELGYRTTFTDYLDDVSTRYPDFDALLTSNGPVAVALSASPYFQSSPQVRRGNPGAKDSYFFTMITATYYLGRYANRGN